MTSGEGKRVEATCERCHGDGEIPVNPGYPDPQTETSARCPECSGSGVVALSAVRDEKRVELSREQRRWIHDALEHYLDSRLKIIDRRARRESGFLAAMRPTIAEWKDLDAGIKRAFWAAEEVEPPTPPAK